MTDVPVTPDEPSATLAVTKIVAELAAKQDELIQGALAYLPVGARLCLHDVASLKVYPGDFRTEWDRAVWRLSQRSHVLLAGHECQDPAPGTRRIFPLGFVGAYGHLPVDSSFLDQQAVKDTKASPEGEAKPAGQPVIEAIHEAFNKIKASPAYQPDPPPVISPERVAAHQAMEVEGVPLTRWVAIRGSWLADGALYLVNRETMAADSDPYSPFRGLLGRRLLRTGLYVEHLGETAEIWDCV